MSEFVMTIGEEHLTIDLDRMKLSEAAQCERLTGMTVPEWIGAICRPVPLPSSSGIGWRGNTPGTRSCSATSTSTWATSTSKP